jgi:DHA1 family bicyclomycin/chloramphenicol resistance-like MFS transporter
VNGEIESARGRQLSAPAGSAVSARLLIVLASLTSLAPFGIDMYLSGFPEMAKQLETSASAIQLTLTAFLVGVAVGQLIFGPLSDRVGRLRPLIVGMILLVAASVAAAIAPTIVLLILARFVQGLSGAAGIVIGRAVISDLATGKEAARAFNVLMLIGGIAPIVAPVIGSLLVGTVGWRGVLGVLAGYTAVAFAAVLVVVRESHPQPSRKAEDNLLGGSLSPHRALSSRAFLAPTAAYVFGFAAMMAYISASPFVYQVVIGMNEVQFGLSFGLNALGIAAASAVSARLARTRSSAALLGIGVWGELVGAVASLVILITGAPLALLTISLFVAVSSVGFILGNATALALAAVRRVAGSGSAVLGAAQFIVAAAVSPIVGLGGEANALPMAICMVASALIAVAGFLVAARVRSS